MCTQRRRGADKKDPRQTRATSVFLFEKATRGAADRRLLILIKAGRRKRLEIGTSGALSGWIEERSRARPASPSSSLLFALSLPPALNASLSLSSSAFLPFSCSLLVCLALLLSPDSRPLLPTLKLPTRTEIFAEGPALFRHHAFSRYAIIRYRNGVFPTECHRFFLLSNSTRPNLRRVYRAAVWNNATVLSL